jgi:hypothetical protein
MAIMRLNGWLRVGIVASVLWVLIGDFFIHGRIIDELGAPVIAELKSCAEADGSDWQACRAAYNRDYPGAMTGHWQYAGIITAIPWALFWVLAFICYVTIRWVRRGFDPQAARSGPSR